jgi:hypothetical protein
MKFSKEICSTGEKSVKKKNPMRTELTTCFRKTFDSPLKQNSVHLVWLSLMLLFAACASARFSEDGNNRRKVQYSILAGVNKGGIVENTDLSLVAGSDLDAFTGATRTGFHAGARIFIPAGKHSAETGVEYMLNRQTFQFNDPENGFMGKREFATHQAMVPFTWNAHLLRRKDNKGILMLKLGALIQVNSMVAISDHGTSLPGYKMNPFSAGATLGLSVYPMALSNGASLGLYLEGYRGSRIYEDHYNKAEFEIPGSSFVRFGISYQFKPE